MLDIVCVIFFFFKQKTAYEMRISDWSSDVCSSDLTVRRGVISMSHGFGGLPEDGDYRVNGSVTNQLISLDRDCQTINAMPRMSGIPVNFRPIEAPLPTRNGSGGSPISGRYAPAGDRKGAV